MMNPHRFNLWKGLSFISSCSLSWKKSPPRVCVCICVCKIQVA